MTVCDYRIIIFLIGNYPLCRVLAQIYEVSPEPLQGHAMALVSLLPQCLNQEKLALLNLFSLIAKNNPTVSINYQDVILHQCFSLR